MRPLIATFSRAKDAQAFAATLERHGIRPAIAKAGAWGEPFDGHELVAAWVPDELDESARELARQAGARLHEAAFAATPDADQGGT